MNSLCDKSPEIGAAVPVLLHPKRMPIYLWLAVAIAWPAVHIGQIVSAYHYGPSNLANQTLIRYAYFFLFHASAPCILLIWSYHAYVKLDSEGINWRIFFTTYRRRWDQVADYYLINLNRDSETMVIITSFERLRLWSEIWDTISISDYIVSHALNARSKQWQELSVRPEGD